MKLGDVFKLSSGKSLPEKKRIFGECNVYGGNGITGNHNEYFVEEPTIVIGRVGEYCGAVHLTTDKCWVTDNALMVTEWYVEVDKQFLVYALNAMNLHQYAKTVGQPSISQANIYGVDINLPSIEQQREIVNVLQKTEEIIRSRNIELGLLDDLIKARFVELFGLPVSNTKGWKTEQMNDVAPSVSYSGDFDEDVWLLNLDMVEAQTGKILDYLIVSEDEVGNSTCTFDTSNVLYSKLRPYLNKVVIPDRCGYATSELVPLQPVVSKITREYLAYMLRSDEFVNMINEKVAGAKMPRVSMGDFRKFKVPVPPMELQNQFADFVKQTDKLKLAVQKSLDETQELFDSLMQKYFG